MSTQGPDSEHQDANTSSELKLLAEISLLLTGSKEFSEIMHTVLEKIGKHLNVNRVYIFEDTEDGIKTTNTYEWCKEGTTPQIQNLQNFAYTDISPWKETLIQDRKIMADDIATLPSNIRDILSPQQIQSILVLPIYEKDTYKGFLGFDDTEKHRVWRNIDIYLLEVISGIYSHVHRSYFTQLRLADALTNLRKKEEYLDLAVACAQVGIWDWNISTGKISLNDSWVEMLGYSLSEFTPLTIKVWESLCHPDDLIRSNELLKKHFARESDIYVCEVRMKHKNGHWAWILDQGKVSGRDENGNPVRMSGTHLDISKKKEEEEQSSIRIAELKKVNESMISLLSDIEEEKNKSLKLVYELEKFKMAVENVSDQIIITDPEGTILYANKSTERITGYSRSEVLGKKAGQLWRDSTPKEFFDQLWTTIKINKQEFFGELTNKNKNGVDYQAEIYITPVLDLGGNILYFVGMERDITRVKEIDRMKSEFISLASHQLRTPLTAVKWLTEMLMSEELGSMNEKQKLSISKIASSNERMINLVNSLLDISRLESGKFVLETTEVSIKDLALDVVEELKHALEIKKLHLSVQIEEGLPSIRVDKKFIRQVYMNLLSNASKYTHEDGEISISIKREGDTILSVVKDTGIGIPVSQQHRIYERFFRADNAVKKSAEGNGLGLYIIQLIVKRSGGTLSFVSEENKGTEFSFTLPISEPIVA